MNSHCCAACNTYFPCNETECCNYGKRCPNCNKQKLTKKVLKQISLEETLYAYPDINIRAIIAEKLRKDPCMNVVEFINNNYPLKLPVPKILFDAYPNVDFRKVIDEQI